ncbi:DUF7544 domain-containing protein [Methanospirillum lacunae]|uniref:Glycerophosphoryl diester phosphodiesterase membrane domain-containing protein n=1 Tax=Methanospirillum lacunae TaxID=668570 RepID=A0A2V2N5B7_9EURY|nr:hypothetical protein [Methanospirillum lacunae]PWR73790.1 hypothetical protein DK846_01070 [Methanospirillum lacunae]
MGPDIATVIDEALTRTWNLLWPLRPGVWIRLAIIALFLGGVVINPFKTDTGLSKITDISSPAAVSGYMDILITLAAGIIVTGAIYVMISSILQFIFVDCLSSGNIQLTRTMRLRWGKGIRLVGFYLVLLLVILITMIFLMIQILIPGMQGGYFDLIRFLILLIETLLISLIVLIPVWIIAILTGDFVVPVMIVDDSGIISGWNKTIRLFSGRWREAGIYTGLKILLIFVTGIILGIVIFLISIPLGLINMAISIGSGLTPDQGNSEIIMFGAGTGVMILISLFLLVPVITFFRYYSLAVLRDLDPDYNLLPE